MNFRELVEVVGALPVFETGLLVAGSVDVADIRGQLARWTRSGRVLQLRRGLYTLAPPWRQCQPHPFLVANQLARGSYVSCEAALAYAHAIPEYVVETTSVTMGRAHTRTNALGRFSFRHLKGALFFGYQLQDLANDQQAFIAKPEKALLDMVHLHPGADDRAYLQELRIDYDALCMNTLTAFAERTGSPKLRRAAEKIVRLADETPKYRPL